MQIGLWEVAFLFLLLLGIILVTRLTTQIQIKRVCPDCGLVMRTKVLSCPTCGRSLSTKTKGRNNDDDSTT